MTLPDPNQSLSTVPRYLLVDPDALFVFANEFGLLITSQAIDHRFIRARLLRVPLPGFGRERAVNDDTGDARDRKSFQGGGDIGGFDVERQHSPIEFQSSKGTLGGKLGWIAGNRVPDDDNDGFGGTVHDDSDR